MEEEVMIPAWKKWFEAIGDQVAFFFKFFK